MNPSTFKAERLKPDQPNKFSFLRLSVGGSFHFGSKPIETTQPTAKGDS